MSSNALHQVRPCTSNHILTGPIALKTTPRVPMSLSPFPRSSRHDDYVYNSVPGDGCCSLTHQVLTPHYNTDDSSVLKDWTEWATRALHLALQFCVSRHQRTFSPRIGGHRRRDNGGAVDQRAQLQELKYNYPTSTSTRRLNVVNHGRRNVGCEHLFNQPMALFISFFHPFLDSPSNYHPYSTHLV